MIYSIVSIENLNGKKGFSNPIIIRDLKYFKGEATLFVNATPFAFKNAKFWKLADFNQETGEYINNKKFLYSASKLYSKKTEKKILSVLEKHKIKGDHNENRKI